MNNFSQNARVPADQEFKGKGTSSALGVRVHFFTFWLFLNSLSSPVNGYSEGR